MKDSEIDVKISSNLTVVYLKPLFYDRMYESLLKVFEMTEPAKITDLETSVNTQEYISSLVLQMHMCSVVCVEREEAFSDVSWQPISNGPARALAEIACTQPDLHPSTTAVQRNWGWYENLKFTTIPRVPTCFHAWLLGD